MFQGRGKDANSTLSSNSSSNSNSNSNSNYSTTSNSHLSADSELRLPGGAHAKGADKVMVFAMHTKDRKKKAEEAAIQNKSKNSSANHRDQNDDIFLFMGLGHPTTAVSLHACEGAYKTCEEIQREAELIKKSSSLDNVDWDEISRIKVQEELSTSLKGIDKELLTTLQQKIQQEKENDPRLLMANGLNRFYNPKQHDIHPNAQIRPEHIFYTVGGAGGLRHLSKIINEKGGCRILTKPHYALHADAHNEGEMVRINVMKQRIVEGVLQDTGYRLRKEDLQAKINSIKSQNKKINALILCNPNNPLGSVLNAAELKDLIDVAIDEDFYLIFDEAYIEMDNAPNVNQFSFLEYILVQLTHDRIKESTYKDLKRRTIILRSGTKGIGAAAARMAVIIAFDTFIQKRLYEENQIIGMPARHLQVGYANAMDKMGSYFLDEELIFNRKFYDTQTQYFFERSKALGIGMPDKKYKPESTFYVLFDLSKFKGMAVNDKNILKEMHEINPNFLSNGSIETDEELAYYLLVKRRIMVAPLSYYGTDPKKLWFRATCSLGIEPIQMLLDRLESEIKLIAMTLPDEEVNISSQMSDINSTDTSSSLPSLNPDSFNRGSPFDSQVSSESEFQQVPSFLQSNNGTSSAPTANKGFLSPLQLIRSLPSTLSPGAPSRAQSLSQSTSFSTIVGIGTLIDKTIKTHPSKETTLTTNIDSQSPMQLTHSLQPTISSGTLSRSQSPTQSALISTHVGAGSLIIDKMTKTDPSKGILQRLLNSEIKHEKYQSQSTWPLQLNSVLANVSSPSISLPPELAKPLVQRSESTPVSMSTKIILSRSTPQSPTHSLSEMSSSTIQSVNQSAVASILERSRSDFKLTVPKKSAGISLFKPKPVMLSSIRSISTVPPATNFAFTTPALLPTTNIGHSIPLFSLTSSEFNLTLPYENYAALAAGFWRDAAKKSTIVRGIREEYYQESYSKCINICNAFMTPILRSIIRTSQVTFQNNKPTFEYTLANEIDFNWLIFPQELSLSPEETDAIKLSLDKLYLNIEHHIQYIAYYIENIFLVSNKNDEELKEEATKALGKILKKQVKDELIEKERDEVLRKQDERLIEELNRRIINKLEEASSAYFHDSSNSALDGFVELIKTKIFFDSFNRVDNECSNILQALYVRRTKVNTKDDHIIKYIKRVVEVGAALDYGHPQGDETYRKIMANALNSWYDRAPQAKQGTEIARIHSDDILFVGCRPEPILKEVFFEIIELDENNYQTNGERSKINKMLDATKFARAILFKNSKEAFSRALTEDQTKEIAEFFISMMAQYQNLYLIIDESFIERCIDKDLCFGEFSLFNTLANFQNRILLVRSGKAIFTSENISVIITSNKECGARLLEESIIIHGHAPRPQQYAYAQAMQNYCNKLKSYLYSAYIALECNQYLQEIQRLAKYFHLRNLPTFDGKHLLQSLYGKIHASENSVTSSGAAGAIYTISAVDALHRSQSAEFNLDEEDVQDQLIRDLQSLVGNNRGTISVEMYPRSLSVPPTYVNQSTHQGTILLFESDTPISEGGNSGGAFTPYTPLPNNISYQARLLKAATAVTSTDSSEELGNKHEEEVKTVKESMKIEGNGSKDKSSQKQLVIKRKRSNEEGITQTQRHLEAQQSPKEGAPITFSFKNYSQNSDEDEIEEYQDNSHEIVNSDGSTVKLESEEEMQNKPQKRKASGEPGLKDSPTIINSSNVNSLEVMAADGTNLQNPAKSMMLTSYSQQTHQQRSPNDKTLKNGKSLFTPKF